MIPTQSQINKFFAIEGKEIPQPEDYSEAFNLVRRLDTETEASFDCMIKFAHRIGLEEHAGLDDVVGELQNALHDARIEVQKRIMAVYARIAEVDVCE